NNRAYLRFGNTDSLHLKIFKVPSKWSLKNSFLPNDSLVNTIIKNEKPQKTVAYKLPNKKDFFTYSTEIFMPSLKKGTYLIAFAADESEFDQPKHKNFTFNTVTDLIKREPTSSLLQQMNPSLINQNIKTSLLLPLQIYRFFEKMEIIKITFK